MTITEQEIEFFKEAKRIQEEWEPKQGDLCAFLNGWGDKGRIMLIAWKRGYRFRLRDWGGEGEYIGNAKQLRVEFTWLPRQVQLQAMLEERGCFWDSCGPFPDTEWLDDCEEYLVEIEYKDATGLLQDAEAYGPTPSIALGKCLLEVLEKKSIDDLDMWIGEDIEAEIKRQFPNG